MRRACRALLAALVAAPSASALRRLRPASRPSALPEEPLEPHYWWPSARGRPGNYSEAPSEGPTELTHSLAWEWHHPRGRYHTTMLGVVIDDQRCLYLAADDAIRKFNMHGNLLWTYEPAGNIPTNPSLWGGALFGSTRNGHVFAVSMETGEPLWSVAVSERFGSDTGSVSVHRGVVVASTDGDGGIGNTHANVVVRGINATDGATLWTFRPDMPVWNFMALFAQDGSFVYQDVEGRAYRNRLDDGTLVWKAGGHPGTWTDGSVMLGPNGVVYAVAIDGCCCAPCSGPKQGMHEDTPGWLDAFRLEDGAALWSQTVARPPNAFPAVGRLAPGAELSVVIPVGKQCGVRTQTDMYAFDAQTGVPRWKWVGPRNPYPACAGDLEGLSTRLALGIRSMCTPNPWSAPTIDAAGAIFAGNQDGRFYRVRDDNFDGQIGASEVSSLDTGAAFSTPGSAHAPGMVAVASCDGLFVFRDGKGF